MKEAKGRVFGEKARVLRNQMRLGRKEHAVRVPCGLQMVGGFAVLGCYSSFWICACVPAL